MKVPPRATRNSHGTKRSSPERLLPTPATSTATSWTNSSSGLSSPTWNEPFPSSAATSEMDDFDSLLVNWKFVSQATKRARRSFRTTRPRPQMIQNPVEPRLSKTSWPFSFNNSRKTVTGDAFINGMLEFYFQKLAFGEPVTSIDALRLALRRQFPYEKALSRVISVRRRDLIICDESTDAMMNSIAQVFAGSSLFDLQKQTEIVFCAWTTMLQYACKRRIIRDDHVPLLTAASTILQAKLMDEADVNVESLLKKAACLKDLTADQVKIWERRVSGALKYKILYPTPHVLLFLFLDNLDAFVSVPKTTKLVAGLVLDNLMASGVFRQLILQSPQRFGRIGTLVFGVLVEVLAHFYVERCANYSLTRRQLVDVLIGTLDSAVKRHVFWESFDFQSPEDILSPNQVSLVSAAISQVRSVVLSGQNYCNT